MRALQFQVSGQSLKKSGDFAHIIRGTKNYLLCEFCFEGNDWQRNKIVAAFVTRTNEYAVAVGANGICKVPNEVTDEKNYKIYLVGVRSDIKIITNKVLIEQEG